MKSVIMLALIPLSVLLRLVLRNGAFYCAWCPLLLLMVIPSYAVDLEVPTGDLTEMSMEELLTVKVAKVYSASRFEQKTSDAPSSVTIITSDEIRLYGWRTLADILRSVQGFYVSYDRDYAHLGVRGFSPPGDFNSRVLLMIDGHRINDNIYNSATIGTELPLDLDLVDRVEIVRGPSSSLYGNSAFFGIINLITRSGKNLNGAEFAAAGGSFDTWQTRATYGMARENGAEMLLSGTWYESAGQRELFFPSQNTPATNNGFVENSDRDRAVSLYTSLKKGGFSLTGAFVSRDKTVPTFGPPVYAFNDARNKTIDEHAYLDCRYRHLVGDYLELEARTAFDWYHYQGNYPYAGQPGLNKDESYGEWLTTSLTATLQPFTGNRLVASAEYLYNIRQDQQNFDTVPPASYLDDSRTSYQFAVALEDEYRILPWLLLNAGVRYDHYSHYRNFSDAVSPRIGLILQPLASTDLKLLYGRAFRAPSVYELYYSDGVGSMVANPDLKPERITTYEVVWEQRLGAIVRTSLAGFYYRFTDPISQFEVAPGVEQFRNGGPADARGVEAAITGGWENGLQVRVNGVLQSARDLRTNAPLPNSPRQTAALNVSYAVVPGKLFFGVEELYIGSRYTGAAVPLLVGGSALTNVTLYGRNLVPGLELTASVYNLFDRQFTDVVTGGGVFVEDAIIQDGISFRVKVTYRF
jgi:iron complex outermembrane receptor protein